MHNSSNLLAHYDRENQKEQLLTNHLLNTATIASDIGKEIGMGNLCFLLGVLHDSGKADIQFQTMLKNMPGSKNIRVIHSTAGAYFLFETKYNRNLEDKKESKSYNEFIEVCMYVIEAHHGLFDIVGKRDEDGFSGMDYVNKIFERVEHYQADSRYDKEKLKHFIDNEVALIVKSELGFDSIEELIDSAFQEYHHIMEQFTKNYVPFESESEKNRKRNKNHKLKERRFFDMMLVRLLLSILKTADVEDTINAYDFLIQRRTEEEIRCLKRHYIEEIEEEYKKYHKNNNPTKSINQMRNQIADTLLVRGQQDGAGIYRLEVPTGAGKTKAVLRYALHQMDDKSKNRFVYITAFLSVLEQNAGEIKAMIGEDGVLEHHSNVDLFHGADKYNKGSFDEKEDIEYVQRSFIVDSWDSPVVLTTMVQFFNILFKGKSANLRRFSSLINSVIVIDEVQSLPIEVMYFFNLTMNFLRNVMNCTVVLCTATQPIYDDKSIRHKLQYGSLSEENKNADLILLSQEDRKCFDRYSVKKLKDRAVDSLENSHTSVEEVSQFVFENRDKSILIVVNTKAAAGSIVRSIDALNIPESDVYYLTTNLCPAHRKNIISEIKERLSLGDKIICVSTQLIEAGVDVDFELVMRSYAGLDSIVQVAGRCNREGKLPNGGEVILFNPDEGIEHTKRILGIADKKKITEEILAQRHGEIQLDSLVKEFYTSYYSNEADSSNRMEYRLKNDESSLFDLFIKGGGIVKSDIKNETGSLRGRLREVADKFQLISDDTEGVFVFYEDGIEDLNDLLRIAEQRVISSQDWLKIKQLIRKLQPYSINIYQSNKLNEFVDSYLNGSIKVLQNDHYNERFGASEEIDSLII